MEALGWNVPTPVESFSFVEDGGAATGAAASGITINYYYGAVSYRYDSASGLYLRYLDGAPYRDLEAGGQLSASNVLIQRVPLRSFDAEGRLEIDLTGEGEMLFFSGGIVESGSWKKDSVTSRTKYYNGSGAEITFRPGQTWIQMVSRNTQVSYE